MVSLSCSDFALPLVITPPLEGGVDLIGVLCNLFSLMNAERLA
jgi:hypothetical protein